MDTFDLSLAGEVDLARQAELAAALEAFRASGLTHVRVDMSHVTFIDSTGLGLLVSLHIAGRDMQGTVTLIDPPPTCLRLLGVAHLTDLFRVEYRGT